jgi:hypothetical protein
MATDGGAGVWTGAGTGNAGSGNSQNVQPSIVVSCIIKYGNFTQSVDIGDGTITAAKLSAEIGAVQRAVQSTYANFPANTTMGNGPSITLDPGDWDISAIINVQAYGATVTTCVFGIDSGSSLNYGDNANYLQNPTASQIVGGCIAGYRVQPTTQTTYYLKLYAEYSGGPPQFKGRISARRVR